MFANITKLKDAFEKPHLALSVIAIGTFILYLKTLGFDFADYDDNVYVTNNTYIQKLTLSNFLYLFTHQFYGHYFPITLSVHAFEYFFFKDNASVYHLVNVLLHLLNIVLAYYVLIGLRIGQKLAIFSVLVFAIHPMNVESVAWIGARNNLLYTTFYLTSLLYYLQYLKEEKWGQYFVMVLVFTLSMLAKSSASSFLLVIIAIDWYMQRKISIKVIIEKIPILLITVVAVRIALNAATAYGSIEDISINYNLADRPFLITYPLWIYLSKLVFPYDLTLRYHNPSVAGELLPMAYYWSALVLLVYLAIWLIADSRRRSFFLLAVFAVNVSMVLKITFSTNVIAAERYVYLAYIGLIPAVFGALGYWFQKFNIKKQLLIWPAGILCVYYAYSTNQRIDVWQNSSTLFTSVLKQEPNNALSYQFMAINEAKRDSFQSALQYINQAIALDSTKAGYYYSKGYFLASLSEIDAAETYLLKALQMEPEYYKALFQLGLVNARQGEMSEAEKYFEQTVALDSTSAEPYFFLGNIKIQEENYEKAKLMFEKAVKYNPNHQAAWFNLGMTYHLEKDKASACFCWIKAQELGMAEATKYIYQVCR